MLAAAGFADIECRDVDVPVYYDPDVDAALASSADSRTYARRSAGPVRETPAPSSPVCYGLSLRFRPH